MRLRQRGRPSPCREPRTATPLRAPLRQTVGVPATTLDGKAAAAAAVPGLITADMVRPGAAVLDVGVSRIDGRIAGDVALDVLGVTGHVAPDRGGVGAMTRAMLLQNVVLAAEQAASEARSA